LVQVGATGHPNLVARREGGRLRISEDGRSWLMDDALSPRDRRRVETERCAASPVPSDPPL
jgi:hypothetical protein